MRRTYGYVAVTKDAAQRSKWTFYEAVKDQIYDFLVRHRRNKLFLALIFFDIDREIASEERGGGEGVPGLFVGP